MDPEEIDPEKLAAAQELTRRILITFVDELQAAGFRGLWPTEPGSIPMPLDVLRQDLEIGEHGASELAARVVSRCRHLEGLLG